MIWFNLIFINLDCLEEVQGSKIEETKVEKAERKKKEDAFAKMNYIKCTCSIIIDLKN